MFTETNAERLVEVRAAIKATMDSLTEKEFATAAEGMLAAGGVGHLVAVPAAFWNDHTSRDLDAVSVEVRSSGAEWGLYDDGSYVVLTMTDDSLAELMSDSAHYSSSFDEEDYGSLMESARRTFLSLLIQSEAARSLLDSRTSYDNLRWALGLERTDAAIITGAA
ncbi:hypothetical protein UFOVP1131_24 [uncultured Caudovirales phage]|uniref:Uncharacterized protein n=1 Tax=uncultured Caudovirales phage TaxID=2100421 RepID=A0A6J7XLY7_9CAUD|nr:hypothetical protein UFOVP966_38 [uncultured Caudovirales phage]CAB4184683.1 hypothetical protein UFOVP1131_24 [uncultured Caudovirales phage]CAB4192586.1 hypothetical protein UFOVP1245_38 [uncultured Caudovirales phage]CAB5231021.1 hypothetical protein UFOVP1582_16 [uncultured Caudovirales phage]